MMALEELPVSRRFQSSAQAAPGVATTDPLAAALAAGRLPEPGEVEIRRLVWRFAGGGLGLTEAGDGPAVGAAAVPSPLPGRPHAWLVVFEAAPPRSATGIAELRGDVRFTGAAATRRILTEGFGPARPSGLTPGPLVIYEIQPVADAALPTAELTVAYRPGDGQEVVITRRLEPADAAASWQAAPPRVRLALLAAELGATLQRPDRTGLEPDLEAIATAAAQLADDLPAAAELARLASRAAEIAAEQP
jgi:hypothetical protein